MTEFLGFNGDTFIKQQIQELVKKYCIDIAIETGTFLGHTTSELAQIVDTVHSIDINPGQLNKARTYLSEEDIDNVHLHDGNSPIVLESLLPNLSTYPILFYLDAHWNVYWPLRDELTSIARNRDGQDIIAIHDFQVPDNPNLGYDSYVDGFLSTISTSFPKFPANYFNKAREILNILPGLKLGDKIIKMDHLNHDYIEDLLVKVYPDGYDIAHNDNATGAMRGSCLYYT